MDITIDPLTHRIIRLDKATKREILSWISNYLKTGKQNPSTAICPWYNVWAKKCGKDDDGLPEFIDRFNEYLLSKQV